MISISAENAVFFFASQQPQFVLKFLLLCKKQCKPKIQRGMFLYVKTHVSYIFYIKNTVFDSLCFLYSTHNPEKKRNDNFLKKVCLVP
jgi:hypothetical protein